MPGIVEVLRDVIDERERAHRKVYPATVVGRNDDGTLQLQRLDGECIARGDYNGASLGEVVVAPLDPFADSGAAGIAGISTRGGVSPLWLESIEPSILRTGVAYTDVIVRGRGFREDLTALNFLRPHSLEINTEITVTAVRFVSEEELELDLVVSIDAVPFGYEAGPEGLTPVLAAIAYDNPGQRL